MLMLALASAENIVAATPLRLAICRPTAASTQQSSIFSTLLMRPARIASANLRRARVRRLAWQCPCSAQPFHSSTQQMKASLPQLKNYSEHRTSVKALLSK